jgi:hypothetical protein
MGGLNNKFRRLSYPAYITGRIISEYRKYTKWKILWKKTCGKRRLRWEHIRRHFSLLLNRGGWRRLAGVREMWR